MLREEADLTREKASETTFISADRIEKIESEKVIPRPDEIVSMAKGYNAPELCYYYCSHECEIGRDKMPDIEPKALSQIVLETINAVNKLYERKARLVEISVDGKISPDEYEDFDKIREELKELAKTADTLQLWIEKNNVNV